MGNLWAFLLQTLWASLTAGLLLIVKRLLVDKLSPRWQYGIWGLLAARLLLPASLRRYVVLPVSDWVELAKTMAEKHLSSAWTAPYMPIVVRSPLPLAAGTPRSVTDWLFLLYCVGIVVVLLRYLTGYLRLRLALRRCPPVSPAVQAALDRNAERYGLPSCPAVAADLPSAMVCGVFRPVLALPGGGEPDEKILLHELLHLKYHDTAQNVFWSLLRALHWCNPFLWRVFDHIQNDLESLCDQRVLERLEGEARREYGYLLLGQASIRYARFPGTSSISNGAANIRRRVEAVARFQRYPQGMALVSV
ncbi:MAG: M56 family metallopeptidase [Oscillibacter sp.]|nr:M56 family metallopeptidase [Oscillibacter sp.]